MDPRAEKQTEKEKSNTDRTNKENTRTATTEVKPGVKKRTNVHTYTLIHTNSDHSNRADIWPTVDYG